VSDVTLTAPDILSLGSRLVILEELKPLGMKRVTQTKLLSSDTKTRKKGMKNSVKLCD
jgi:hypothetical protein